MFYGIQLSSSEVETRNERTEDRTLYSDVLYGIQMSSSEVETRNEPRIEPCIWNRLEWNT